ncbi:hypothetical protein COW36_08055 [bacterium (Candidatus Blackallbacteria) CG17_big_fil_post_rev_8_21_14_2_50_48_46]|uniref:Uncharacterized protein n=1 Tax=bacterium (Candidatus Blackallbacteria) CG17_big_fil_post_rev_8_21_14_2_50_48_46 TaxID=2014261 RepID=A0A2M7G621_9BACT|nr:MAG: hypothetical protein COW64_24595 [bacterium (Candidatus Blackallbacteria) CG18_big_fil_WC_8_21_14_2_50_49_26]PIW17442.1 MAG: hypothetical protein COW36_08055 [bacterium (Candidatus Blackallbacteria) CG17_big_fil_post_rev_8_21_14_2_50_48_46]PIW48296.1 MAG: hypothetical protein COW20_09410 [bacterium (Candidatus Blackallbacteria) CG13_big_fil_rev_8_21_14_2_50_49_14]
MSFSEFQPPQNPNSQPNNQLRENQKLPPLQRGLGIERMQRQQKLTSQMKQHSLNLKLEHAKIVQRGQDPDLELLKAFSCEELNHPEA